MRPGGPIHSEHPAPASLSGYDSLVSKDGTLGGVGGSIVLNRPRQVFGT